MPKGSHSVPQHSPKPLLSPDLMRRANSFSESDFELCNVRTRQAIEEQQWQDDANEIWARDGEIPSAERPAWLPFKGRLQKDVEPQFWTMSIEHWLFFIYSCMQTDTWKALAGQLGDAYEINMYHLRDHFVNPWTKSTGSSIALLMNPDDRPVELMISHAWAGSVKESFHALQSVAHDSHAPNMAIFFCTLSMYQPGDDAGLSIGAQLEKDPFAQIIAQRPCHGMYVLHTTIYEVYQRLWTVHEVDEASEANIELKGQCDYARFQLSSLEEALAIDTTKAQCREEDRLMLDTKIRSRSGGYQRLDNKIAQFRQSMMQDFKERYFVSGHMVEDPWTMEKEHAKIAWWNKCMETVESELVLHANAYANKAEGRCLCTVQ